MRWIFLFSMFFSIFVYPVIVASVLGNKPFLVASASTGSGYAVRACGVMDEPYRDAKEIASLKKGASVTILKRKGGWLKISTGAAKGWVRMMYVRRGKKRGAPSATRQARGVLGLAGGRAGSGNVVASTGVRGLDEEELKEAEYSAKQIKKLESFTVSKKKAKKFAKKAKLKSRKVKFLP